MATFKAGPHEWRVNLPFGLMKKINEQLGLDLTKLVTDETTIVNVLFTDPEKLAAVFWTICEAQAKEAGVTEEAFGMLLTGEVLEAATDAMLGAVIDFFPKARGRDAMKRTLKRATIAMAKAAEDLIDRTADSAFSRIASKSPASPE